MAASRAKAIHQDDILAKPNVVGVGVGYKVQAGRQTDELAVVVLVEQKLPRAALAPQALLTEALDGVPTDVVEVGVLRALQAPTDRWRPAPGGVSIGHYQITAGTFGVTVRDRTTGDRLILSNNHVLANSNNASEGDPILQPGAADGGSTANDIIAHLERFCPIEFALDVGVCDIASAVARLANMAAQAWGSTHQLQPVRVDPTATNLVDAAVARPVDDADILDEIHEIGTVTDVAPATLGLAVRKSGRSTGLTTGEITVMEATVSVNYGTGRVARFDDQLITTPMSAPGDSGSLLVAADAPHAVGLLFAGSDQTTIHSPITAVFDCLDVELAQQGTG
jgi:hypothetical protein